MRAILFAGGYAPSKERLAEYIRENDIIISADSGYDSAKSLGLTPNIIIGDMDSVKAMDIAEEKIIYPKRKELTDSELILEYAIKNGYTELYLFGFIGTRMDHTLANLSIIFDYPDTDITIVDDHNEIKILKKENEIFGKKGDIVSIIPFGEDLVGVSLENFEYPLNSETLYFKKARGVSNVMTDSFARVKVMGGRGFIIKSKD